jgi:hypothetical protein
MRPSYSNDHRIVAGNQRQVCVDQPAATPASTTAPRIIATASAAPAPDDQALDLQILQGSEVGGDGGIREGVRNVVRLVWRGSYRVVGYGPARGQWRRHHIPHDHDAGAADPAPCFYAAVGAGLSLRTTTTTTTGIGGGVDAVVISIRATRSTATRGRANRLPIPAASTTAAAGIDPLNPAYAVRESTATITASAIVTYTCNTNRGSPTATATATAVVSRSASTSTAVASVPAGA